MSETRRDTLRILGALTATAAAPIGRAQEHNHPATAPPETAPYTPQVLSATEYALVSRIADLIIPPTDTPGAAAAGVPAYIDRALVRNADTQQLIREGLALTDKAAQSKFNAKFLDLDETRQITLLVPWSEASDKDDLSDPGAKFFRAIKSMTADGYYTSFAGLVQELGYKGNQALASFPGCTHEH